MSAHRLRTFPLLLARPLRNHTHTTFRPRPALKLQSCGISGTTPSLAELTTVHTPSTGNTPDSNIVPTIPADDGAAKARADRKVAILWDLDNKTPVALPEDLAMSIRHLAEKRGEIVEYSAMANYRAFVGLPAAARDLKKERESLRALEKHGNYKPAELYRCPVCGGKFQTDAKLQKHYEQLHERERSKKLARLRSLKGKKRRKWLTNNGENLSLRNIAHETIKFPENKHKVFRSLKRAGVLVRIVTTASQAADNALRHRFGLVPKNSELTLIVISDDSDFFNMIMRAKSKYGVHAIVIGSHPHGKLARAADEWLSWRTLNAAQDPPTLREKLAILADTETSGNDDGKAYVVEDDVKNHLLALSREEED
ncbi:hypothetical protein F4779DRAFT_567022 [Xylariaceae sp. FL0662B]|nr:hypothetical protein F4779DRAFT_567022 [Xylariaceae sp. FL0662B]